jgi:hypothetical protein
MFKTNFVEKSKKKIIFKTFFPPKTVPFMRENEEVWYSLTGHKRQNNTPFALCMLDN